MITSIESRNHDANVMAKLFVDYFDYAISPVKLSRQNFTNIARRCQLSRRRMPLKSFFLQVNRSRTQQTGVKSGACRRAIPPAIDACVFADCRALV